MSRKRFFIPTNARNPRLKILYYRLIRRVGARHLERGVEKPIVPKASQWEQKTCPTRQAAGSCLSPGSHWRRPSQISFATSDWVLRSDWRRVASIERLAAILKLSTWTTVPWNAMGSFEITQNGDTIFTYGRPGGDSSHIWSLAASKESNALACTRGSRPFPK